MIFQTPVEQINVFFFPHKSYKRSWTCIEQTSVIVPLMALRLTSSCPIQRQRHRNDGVVCTVQFHRRLRHSYRLWLFALSWSNTSWRPCWFFPPSVTHLHNAVTNAAFSAVISWSFMYIIQVGTGSSSICPDPAPFTGVHPQRGV